MQHWRRGLPVTVPGMTRDRQRSLGLVAVEARRFWWTACASPAHSRIYATADPDGGCASGGSPVAAKRRDVQFAVGSMNGGGNIGATGLFEVARWAPKQRRGTARTARSIFLPHRRIAYTRRRSASVAIEVPQGMQYSLVQLCPSCHGLRVATSALRVSISHGHQ